MFYHSYTDSPFISPLQLVYTIRERLFRIPLAFHARHLRPPNFPTSGHVNPHGENNNSIL